MATTFGQESFLDLKFNNHWVSRLWFSRGE